MIQPAWNCLPSGNFKPGLDSCLGLGVNFPPEDKPPTVASSLNLRWCATRHHVYQSPVRFTQLLNTPQSQLVSAIVTTHSPTSSHCVMTMAQHVQYNAHTHKGAKYIHAKYMHSLVRVCVPTYSQHGGGMAHTYIHNSIIYMCTSQVPYIPAGWGS